jgi:TetR/AcrR family transcriptional repressor for divergent bdcA
MQAGNMQARELATAFAKQGSDIIRDNVAHHAVKKDVDRIADYVLLTLLGLSSYAHLHYSQKELIDCSRTAGRAFDRALGQQAST